jgi:predicted AAA+ superfamily ATPase
MPKLYFNDTGLASSLLGISTAEQLDTHYQFGALFENFIISELLKKRFHEGKRSNLYFWRDHKGSEIDVIIEQADTLIPIEIKAAQTYTHSFFSGINYWRKLSKSHDKQQFVVFGGKGKRETQYGTLLGWEELKYIP